MGGQTVSFILNGVAQCDILKSRLTKNPSYNKSIGNAQGLDGHHHERMMQMFDMTNVTVEVQDIHFYACMCRVNLDSSGKEEIHLMEMEVMNSNIASNNNTNINQEFTVPSSTRAVTTFIQDMNAGKETSCPPSRFTLIAPYQLDAMNLRDYQIEYANMTEPVIRIDSQYVAGSNPMY